MAGKLYSDLPVVDVLEDGDLFAVKDISETGPYKTKTATAAVVSNYVASGIATVTSDLAALTSTVAGKQASDGDLTAIAALTDVGIVRRTATDTWSAGTTVATAEIAADAVTYAKIQNVSAAARFLGRWTAGAGDVEEGTGAQAGGLIALGNLSNVNAPTPTDTHVLTWDAGSSKWVSSAAPGAGSGAPTDADYLVKTAQGGLSAERVVTDTAGAGAITVDWATAGQAKFNVANTNLTAIGGLTSAANKGITFTGAGTAAVYDLSAAALTLLDDAAPSNMRTTLGVVIGTDVQAYDAELAALAGLTSAANKGITFTGSGTAAVYDLSAFSLTLLDDATPLAARTTLNVLHEWQMKVESDTTTLTVADGKLFFMIPASLNGLNFITAHAGVSTVSSSGTPTIQIRNVTDSVDLLSTKITIDASEKTSYSAAIPPVINAATDDVATGDIWAVDCDVAGSGAKGLMVHFVFG